MSSSVFAVSNAAIFKWINPDSKKLSSFHKSWNQQVAKPESDALARNFLLFPACNRSDDNLNTQD